MYFKSLSDLTKDIHGWIPTIEGRYDCVVGVPRSGMLVANIVALKMNLPLGDLDGFLKGRLLAMGRRFGDQSSEEFLKTRRRVLIIDDSIASGAAMRIARKQIEESAPQHDLTIAAVYVTPEGCELCDIYAQVIPNPRRFEWNILSSPQIQYYQFDLDGVLCVDPTYEENDDGPKYVEFIRNAKPLFIPSHEIGAIVTSRLERYRADTEAWLERYDVQYGELLMLDLASKEERIRTQAAPKFKAKTYRQSGADLFIESDAKQAVEIARLSGKFVYAVDEATIYGPNAISSVLERQKITFRKKIRMNVGRVRRLLGRLKSKFGRSA
ncbi:phosphoribosyltransferase family protein [Opitutales bacterium]|nr:phosphoribosyltransferase family protein [Opitutales bacterium]